MLLKKVVWTIYRLTSMAAPTIIFVEYRLITWSLLLVQGLILLAPYTGELRTLAKLTLLSWSLVTTIDKGPTTKWWDVY